MPGKMVKKTITISEEQDRFLIENPDINLSGLVQKVLQQQVLGGMGVLHRSEFEKARVPLTRKVLAALASDPDKALNVQEVLKRLDMPNSVTNTVTLNLVLFMLEVSNKVELALIRGQSYYALKKKKTSTRDEAE